MFGAAMANQFGRFVADSDGGATASIAHGAGCLCGLSRRKFLAGAVAAGAAGFTAQALAQAPASPSAAPARRIDVHHHMLPPAYIEKRLSIGVGEGSTEVSQWTPARTLEQMDRNGIATAVLSLSQPGIKFDDVEGTRSMLRYCNEYGAQLVRDHPGRFGLFAALPLSDIEGSLRELEYAFDVLKADGVGLLTSYGSRYPGDPYFEPVFAELNRRKAVAFFHPNMPLCCNGILAGVPGPTIEYQFNTARAITNLLFTGTFTRLPDIKYIFCHAGGAMTPQVARIVRTAEHMKKVAERLPNGAMAEIRKLYYDTAQSAYPENFGALKSFVPISQILLGTDYPYVLPAQTVEPLMQFGLNEAELAAVTRNNALALFPRLGVA
jgi:predicted TIM-barrel fold metal-dependent hydrolase